MPSFDIVSRLDNHEVDNAVQQAAQEITQRYDFKGTKASVEKNDAGILVQANSEGRVEAAYEVLCSKLAKRKVSLKSIDPQTIEPAGQGLYKMLVKLKEGVNQDAGKKIVKSIKDSKIKVQAAIQSDEVRVSGKKRDDLQEVMGMLKSQDFGLDLQYVNFRD